MARMIKSMEEQYLLPSAELVEAVFTAHENAQEGKVVRSLVEEIRAMRYYVPELERTFMGSTLMNVGICPSFEQGDFMTVKYHFVADVLDGGHAGIRQRRLGIVGRDGSGATGGPGEGNGSTVGSGKDGAQLIGTV